MAPSHSRAAVRGSTFVRLLARLGEVDAGQPGGFLPDRLSQWLSWTQSLALSSALDGAVAPLPEGAEPGEAVTEASLAAARAALVETLMDEPSWARARARAVSRAGAVEGELDSRIEYSAFRERYLMMQRSIQGTTGKLRGELRDQLAAASPELARLAEVDAVMEGALSPREQRLLGGVPAVLEARFEKARKAAAEAQGTSGVWIDLFVREMQDVLLAELDVRFQPLEGLLAALQSPSLVSHA
ncbi:DUF3348 domain-containing protein [Luteibacter pinisoli]|uniref:DUF3348 domain-containing protein n=1 Tax=Luteibacter pinisoli TaxID=2589080 RepID=A0A4Y5Z0F7_9GAMM|nr:DUF3348 domain-containing protein [Luteibacter pinisoli]